VATDLIEIDPDQPKSEAIERGASALRRGKVVAIPTDALYTLVADPFNLRAVNRVFCAKGREIHRSLPLLVAERDGSLREPFARIGALRIEAPTRRRRRRTIIARRRPSIRLRRRAARLPDNPAVYSGEREIIARN